MTPFPKNPQVPIDNSRSKKLLTQFPEKYGGQRSLGGLSNYNIGLRDWIQWAVDNEIIDLMGGTSSNWFTGDQTQEENRAHDQAGFTTTMDNIGELKFSTGEGVGHSTLRLTPLLSSLVAVNDTDPNEMNWVQVIQNLARLFSDNATELQQVITSTNPGFPTKGVNLRSSTQEYWIGDGAGTLLPPVEAPTWTLGLNALGKIVIQAV